MRSISLHRLSLGRCMFPLDQLGSYDTHFASPSATQLRLGRWGRRHQIRSPHHLETCGGNREKSRAQASLARRHRDGVGAKTARTLSVSLTLHRSVRSSGGNLLQWDILEKTFSQGTSPRRMVNCHFVLSVEINMTNKAPGPNNENA